MQHRLLLRQWRILVGTGGCAESVRCRAASLAISITAGTNAKYFTCGECQGWHGRVFPSHAKLFLGNSHQNSHSPKIKMAADFAS
jgi:hypothetical protein